MIYKELDPFQSDDKFARSGRAAEEQMAFYFKRFFGNDPDLLVLNGIRLEADGDAAQVDHLVIHARGLAIVESKSVHGKIQIKDDGQWIRWFGTNQSRGMQSPITQARLQEKFFRTVLGRASRNEALFASIPVDLLVAVSDGGVIIWPKSGPIQGVCKADQVPDKILEKMQGVSATADAIQLSPENREKIAAFLVAAHRPLVRNEVAPLQPPSPAEITAAVQTGAEASSAERPKCKHCGSEDLEIRFARTYFFHCRACEKNTAIKIECPTCREAIRLRKQKQEFFGECDKCSRSEVYFVNP